MTAAETTRHDLGQPRAFCPNQSKPCPLVNSRHHLCYIPRPIFSRNGTWSQNEQSQIRESETSQRGSSYAFEALEQFIERHLAEGHDIRMFLDRNGNSYSIFCIKCDPRMAELTGTAINQLHSNLTNAIRLQKFRTSATDVIAVPASCRKECS
jgi:hypothetical protein